MSEKHPLHLRMTVIPVAAPGSHYQEALWLSGTNHWLRFKVAHATPAQRCEAFLKTLKLWDDEPY